MKRVKLENDKKTVYLVIRDEDTGETMTVTLDGKEAQRLGEALFRSGRFVDVEEPAK